ncbi:MAG: protein kinase [Candidatus Limnocylindrales bacterium]
MALGDGSVLGGYRIERLIGRGGMGAVYLADDVRLGRKVALKVLAAETAELPAVRERFVRESHLAASLDHPHILPIFEAGEADGQLFMAMRYVPGPDLAGLIARDGPLALERTVALIGQVASALDAAHGAGLIHRDVKPGNILVAPGSAAGTDHAYLSDFGLTKHAAYSGALTRSGQLMGSVGYVAPEQIENRPIDARVDVYSLGCVLYECLAGTQPYPRDTEMATLYAHVQAPPPSLAAARPELPPAIDAVIATALAKDPDARYASAGALALALAAAAAPDGPAGHLTRGFLFADLRGYTAYVEAHGDAAAATLLDTYRRLVRDVVRRFGGAEIKTEGDSFYVVFPSASEAVRCGLALVAAAATATREHPAQPIAVGVGVHAGETAETPEGYVGSAVNLAARLCAEAAAGEVLVSDTVRGLTRTSGAVTFTARGRKHLKGIAEPMAIFAATTAAPGVDGTAGAPPVRPPITTRLLGFGDPRRVVVAAGGGAVVVALAVLLAAGTLGGAFGPSPSPRPSGTGSLGLVGLGSPSAVASTSSARTRILDTSTSGLIKPDTYTIMGLPGTPTLTFTDEGWSANPFCACTITLGRTSSPNDKLVIVWPTELATDVCGLQPTAKVGRNPEAQFLTWAQNAKGLQLSTGTLRQFGDLSTTELDGTVLEQHACQYTEPVSVAIGVDNGGPYLNFGQRFRLEVTSRDSKLVLIIMEAPSTAEFEALKPLAETLLNTLHFPQ